MEDPREDSNLFSLYALQVFREVARHNSLTRAAQELGISQPAVSRQIKILEERYQERLLDRTPRGVVPTRCGQALVLGSHRVFAQLEDLARAVKVASGKVGGEVRVAASTTPGAYLLPSLLKAFQERYPEALATLSVEDSEGAAARVLDYQAHLGVLGSLASLSPELEQRPVDTDLVGLVAHPDNPLAHTWEVQAEDLRPHTLLLRERGSSTREQARTLLGGLLTAFGRVLEFKSAEAIKEAVIAGLGVSVLSSWAIRRELQAGLLVRVPDPRLRRGRPFYLVRRSDRSLEGAPQALWEFLVGPSAS